jgi:flagellar biosynthesis/type III secretory pathway protein FliH
MSAYDLLVAKGVEKGIEKGFQDGMETGFQNGMETGEYQNARKVILTLFSKFPTWSDSEIAEIANVSADVVEAIREEVASNN